MHSFKKIMVSCMLAITCVCTVVGGGITASAASKPSNSYAVSSYAVLKVDDVNTSTAEVTMTGSSSSKLADSDLLTKLRLTRTENDDIESVSIGTISWKDGSKKSSSDGSYTKKGTAPIRVQYKDHAKTYKVKLQASGRKTKKTSLKLNKKTASLSKGKTCTLKATLYTTTNGTINYIIDHDFVNGGAQTVTKHTIKTNTDVSWKSSDTSIATVSSKGVVKAKKAGKVTITATSKKDKSKSAKCTITVKNSKSATSKSNSKVQSVKIMQHGFSVNKILMEKGNTTSLKASISPSYATNSKVTWKSNNTKVATVSANGVVTAKKNGTATITATAKDGSKKKASVKIVVKNLSGSSVSHGTSINSSIGSGTNVSVSTSKNNTTSGKTTSNTTSTSTSSGNTTSATNAYSVASAKKLASFSNATVHTLAPKADKKVLDAFDTLGFTLKISATVNYSGLHDARDKSITLNVNGADNGHTIYHELGHFLAFIAGNMDKASSFTEVYEEEKGLYTDYNKAYITSTAAEYFGESYYNYCTNPSKLKAERPKTYDMIVKALDNVTDTQIARIANIYKVVWDAQ